jgi:TRAP-type C4-dicarboxylate transport system permease small subunit
MQAIERVVTNLVNALAVVGLSILMVLATLTLIDGLLRALVNYPLDFVREVGELVAAICGATCLPASLLNGSNIVLKALGEHLPTLLGRIIEVMAGIVILTVVIAMAWQFYLLSVKTMAAGEVTWLINLPRAPFLFVVDAILWVAVLAQAFVLLCQIFGIDRETHSEPAV